MFFKPINLIKLNLLLKNNVIKVKLIKSDFVILKIFIKLNIIKSIKKDKNNFYLIKLNEFNMFHSIKNLYKPSQLTSISLKNLKKINKKKSNLFYISTSKGVMNNFEAEQNNVGGLLIMNIWI